MAGVIATALGLERAQAAVLGTLLVQSLALVFGAVGRKRLPAAWSGGGGPGWARQFLRNGVPFGLALVAIQVAGVQVVIAAARLVGLGEAAQTAGLGEQAALFSLLRSLGPGGKALLVMLLVVGAPVAEELFFRGYLYALLRAVAGMGVLGAALASGLAFAALHGYVVHFPALWLTGVALALWYERHRHLTPVIGAHFAANSLMLLVTVASQRLVGSPWPS